MKKLIIALLSLCLWLPSLAHAEDLSLANGTYTNTEATFVRSIVIEDNKLTLVLAEGALYTHLQDIVTLQTKYANIPIINPNLSAEELSQKRQELGLDIDMKALLAELEQNVDSNATPADVQKLIESRFIGAYFHLDLLGTSYIQLTQPYLAQSDSLISVQLFDEELLLFEKITEDTLKYGEYDYVKE